MPDLIEVLQPAPTILEVTETPVQVVTVVEQGPRGPRGPAGAGETLYTQDAPAGTWIIPHDIGRPPLVACYTPDGDRVYPDEHATDTSLTLVFATPMAGLAVLI